MNSFMTRFLSGIVYVFVLIISIWFDNTYTLILFGFFLIVGTKELYQITKLDKSLVPLGILINLGVYILISRLWFHSYILFIFIPISLLFIRALFQKNLHNPFHHVALSLLPLIYISLPLCMALRVPYITDEGFRPELLLGTFILIWSADTFAYLTGRKFGKTKLFERVSPNKTWEGSIGGAVCTIGIGFVFNLFWPLSYWYVWPIIAIIAVVFGTLGDLVESILKRSANVKDSGNIMPGHGGVLDRLDSFIFAIPIIYLTLSML